MPSSEEPTISLAVGYTVRNGLIEEISVIFAPHGTYGFLSLQQVLEAYGRPDDVWLSAYSHAPGPLPMRLFLVYSNQDFLIEYEIISARNEGEEVVACFDEVDRIIIWLVAAEREISFEEAREETLMVSDDQFYLPIEEATGMSVDEFFGEFKSPESDRCIHTPSKLWP